MPALEIAKAAGAVAAVGALGWTIARYALDRRVALSVTAEAERRASDGIRVQVRNRSRARSVKVREFEVLHKPVLHKPRVPEKVGPFMEPATPWQIGPDDDKEGWVALAAVDGRGMGPGEAKWDFSRRVRVRLVLTNGRKVVSKRFKAKKP
jgi:hypothetical protein